MVLARLLPAPTPTQFVIWRTDTTVPVVADVAGVPNARSMFWQADACAQEYTRTCPHTKLQCENGVQDPGGRKCCPERYLQDTAANAEALALAVLHRQRRRRCVRLRLEGRLLHAAAARVANALSAGGSLLRQQPRLVCL